MSTRKICLKGFGNSTEIVVAPEFSHPKANAEVCEILCVDEDDQGKTIVQRLIVSISGRTGKLGVHDVTKPIVPAFARPEKPEA